MKNSDFKRTDNLFSLCGLNCNLCPGFVRGDCGGCSADSPCTLTCTIAPCSVKHGNVEYCFRCEKYPCDKYVGFDQHDSMVLHRNIKKDVEKAKRIGIEAYREEQRAKKKILDRLLKEYDDGQKDVFFCLAVNMLEIADLKDALEQAEKATETMNQPEKAAYMERQLHSCADKRNLVLELLITDEPWFK